jgi:hypothetical protein
MQIINKIIFLFILVFNAININLYAADKSAQMVYAEKFGAYISAPPGWIYVPANANDEKLGILALYKIKNKSINDSQIIIQMIPKIDPRNNLEIQIKNDKDRNLQGGGKFLRTEFIKTNSDISSCINAWTYPTNNNFIGIVPTEMGTLIVGGYSMKKNLDNETKIAVEQIIKDVKFLKIM